MQLIRLVKGVQSKASMVVCLGCFDGVHAGHQALIHEAIRLSKKTDVLSGCLSFEPYPKEYFSKKNGASLLPRLLRFRDKYQVLKFLGLDRLVVSRFNEALANMSAEDFVKEILHQSLFVTHVVVGSDFRFGKKREAGVTELGSLLQVYDIKLTVISPIDLNGLRVSSTEVRQALSVGDLSRVSCLLGRPFSVSGRVSHGQKRGRLLGFPTANVHLPPETLPMTGVFVVTLTRANGDVLEGVANVGSQPTVGQHHVRLEVHCLNFDGNLYDENVRVTVLKRLRGVIKFSGLDALKEQIANDKSEAELFFQKR